VADPASFAPLFPELIRVHLRASAVPKPVRLPRDGDFAEAAGLVGVAAFDAGDVEGEEDVVVNALPYEMSSAGQSFQRSLQGVAGALVVPVGKGGFGGEKSPEAKVPGPPAGKAPDFKVSEATTREQALLQRTETRNIGWTLDPRNLRMAPNGAGARTRCIKEDGVERAAVEEGVEAFRAVAAEFHHRNSNQTFRAARGIAEHEFRAGIPQNEMDRLARKLEIHRDADQTSPHDAVIGREKFHTIGRENGHPVAACHAEPREADRERVGELVGAPHAQRRVEVADEVVAARAVDPSLLHI